MNERMQSRFLIWSLFGCLVAAVLWGQWRMNASRAEAETAAENLEACRWLAAEIATLRERPTLAALEARSTTDVARRIEVAAEQAQVPADRILRINPQPARRLGDTAYKEQATTVELRLVTLKQLIEFLVTLTGNDAELDVSAIRLSAPRNETVRGTGDESWQAELTLTFLVFSPKSSQFQL